MASALPNADRYDADLPRRRKRHKVSYAEMDSGDLEYQKQALRHYEEARLASQHPNPSIYTTPAAAAATSSSTNVNPVVDTGPKPPGTIVENAFDGIRRLGPYASLYRIAAESSRLDSHAMSKDEQKKFSEFLATPELSQMFLEIRNHILAIWYEDCYSELTIGKLLASFTRPIDKKLAVRIHAYLSRSGRINFGIIRRAPVAPLGVHSKRRHVVVVGAGVSGLSAARQLDYFGFDVTILEGRARVGGRVSTYESGPYKADLGAMVITGLGGGNPLFTICKQVNLRLHQIRPGCPIYDHTGKQISSALDDTLEKEFNMLLDATKKIAKLAKENPGLNGKNISLAEAFELAKTIVMQSASKSVKTHHLETIEQTRQIAKCSKELVECRMKIAQQTKQEPGPAAETGRPIDPSNTSQENGSHNTENTSNIVIKQEAGVEALCNEAVKTIDSIASESNTLGMEDTSAVVNNTLGNGSNVSLMPQVDGAFGDDKSSGLKPDPDAQVLSNGNSAEVLAETWTNRRKEEKLKESKEDERKLLIQYEHLSEERRKLAARGPDNYWTTEANTVLDWHVANLEFANATTIDTLSLEHWDQDDVHEFLGSHLTCKDGFSTVPRALASGLNVQLNCPVREIDYGNDGVSIKYSDKTTESDIEDKTIKADAVIVSLPLGVLKANTVKFTPQLPSWKQESIDRLGFGLLNKVILCFEKCFWNTKLDTFGYCMHPKEGVTGEYYMFWNFMECTGEPVLLALNAGHAAHAQEQRSQEELVQKAVDVLGKIFQPENVARVSMSHVTKWKEDEYAKGSYSYIAVEATGEDYDVLSYPVESGPNSEIPNSDSAGTKKRLYFAGEHTIRDYPATVHGALLSGLREAERVMTTFESTYRPES